MRTGLLERAEPLATCLQQPRAEGAFPRRYQARQEWLRGFHPASAKAFPPDRPNRSDTPRLLVACAWRKSFRASANNRSRSIGFAHSDSRAAERSTAASRSTGNPEQKSRARRNEAGAVANL